MGGVVRTKRVYDDPAPQDGYRVLVDRLWPRGVSRERAAVGTWLKEVAPSAQLRTWWDHDPARLKKLADSRGHKGPYLPVLVYASRDDQFSYEYQHGSVAHGAFTYSLVKTLRRDRRLKVPKLTFESLVDEVGKELAELGYEQQPSLVAPTAVAGMKVPLRP